MTQRLCHVLKILPQFHDPRATLTEDHESHGADQHDEGLQRVCVYHRGQATWEKRGAASGGKRGLLWAGAPAPRQRFESRATPEPCRARCHQLPGALPKAGRSALPLHGTLAETSHGLNRDESPFWH